MYLVGSLTGSAVPILERRCLLDESALKRSPAVFVLDLELSLMGSLVKKSLSFPIYPSPLAVSSKLLISSPSRHPLPRGECVKRLAGVIILFGLRRLRLLVLGRTWSCLLSPP